MKDGQVSALEWSLIVSCLAWRTEVTTIRAITAPTEADTRLDREMATFALIMKISMELFSAHLCVHCPALTTLLAIAVVRAKMKLNTAVVSSTSNNTLI